jgi:NAD(P)H-hydrate epimerase
VILGTTLPEAVLIPLSAKGSTFSRTALLPLKEALKKADALLMGSGLGISDDVRFLVRELLSAAQIPVVLDADGINLIADDIEFLKEVKADLILTPHPGEMSRLTGKTVAEIESDRIGIAREFAKEYGVTLVLKGANTVISDKEGNVRVNIGGNPAMATAGSGDMLAGIMATMLTKGMPPLMAAEQAVWLHSAAGDLAREEMGENAVLPTDMIELLRRVEGYDPLVYGAFKPLP